MEGLLGKVCGDCRRPLTRENRGSHSFYFCKICDEERVCRINGRLKILGVTLTKKGSRIE
ncbi:MAG: hypothetical protein DDT19_02584 [Syntrophomonadaceae bacterium]|nr:hypothetical protein [Bacillota bacterium]